MSVPFSADVAGGKGLASNFLTRISTLSKTGASGSGKTKSGLKMASDASKLADKRSGH